MGIDYTVFKSRDTFLHFFGACVFSLELSIEFSSCMGIDYKFSRVYGYRLSGRISQGI